MKIAPTIALVASLCVSAGQVAADNTTHTTARQEAIIAAAPPPQGSINSGLYLVGILAALVLVAGDF